MRALASGLLRDTQLVEVARRNAPDENVTQHVYPVDRARKRDMLIQLIEDHSWSQVLVFTRTKHGANALAEKLDKSGIRSAAIHGNKSQGARTRALADFKGLKLNVLVATDIAARGLDIDQLPHVVNFELPHVPEDYVHRIGRTARAGASGQAVSLVCVDDTAAARYRTAAQADIEKRAAGVRARSPHPPGPIENGRNKGRQGKPSGQRSAQRGSQAPGKAVRGSGGSGRTPAGRHSETRHP